MTSGEASEGAPAQARGNGPAYRDTVRLLVDLSVICKGDQGTGIQRVVRSIWRHLPTVVGANVEVIPVAPDPDGGYIILAADFLSAITFDPRGAERITPARGDIFIGLDLAARSLPEREKLFAAWKVQGVLVYLLVYDLLPTVDRRWFRWRSRRAFRRWLGFLARQADGAICISRDVENSLRAWLGTHAPARLDTIEIGSIRLGQDICESLPSMGVPSDAAARIAAMRAAPTVIMVGTVEPRKGHDVALGAFEKIWADPQNPPVNLLVVGRPGWKTKLLQRRMRRLEKQEPRFAWLDQVSDEYLALLYRECAGLLSCSRAEGYGLPVMEALHFGAPVLARALPVLQENAGDAICYYECDDSTSLSAAILSFLREAQSTREAASRPEGFVGQATWVEATIGLLSHIQRSSGYRLLVEPPATRE